MTQNKTNPGRLPYGCGSIQRRGNVWWMIYRDAEGKTVQESSKTAELADARRMLAERALIALRAKVAVLEEIVGEQAPPKKERREPELRGTIIGAEPGPESQRAAADLVKFLLEVAARRKREREAERAAKAKAQAPAKRSGKRSAHAGKDSGSGGHARGAAGRVRSLRATAANRTKEAK
jgi:hypothetical protein